MTFQVTDKWLAEILWIVGDNAPETFKYDSAVSYLTGKRYRSNRARWSPLPAQQFSSEEFVYFLKFAFKHGYIQKTNSGGANIAEGHLDIKTDELELTLKGWRFVEVHGRPILEKTALQLWQNIPTIITSVAIALVSAYLLRTIGLQK